MKNCHDVDLTMTPYVDGEVSADEAAAVEAHLAECSPCRERAQVETAMKRVVQARATAIGEHAPDALRARCVAAVPETSKEGETVAVGGLSAFRLGRQRLAGWVPLSMAATVLLAVAAVFVLGQNQQLEAAFAAQLAIDHERCFSDVDDLTEGFDARQAERALASAYDLNVAMPPESADFDVLDVRQCLYDEGEMAHVLCAWRGQPMSLFVVPGRSTREQLLEVVGHDALTWSGAGDAYVLVADRSQGEIEQVSEYVRRFLDEY